MHFQCVRCIYQTRVQQKGHTTFTLLTGILNSIARRLFQSCHVGSLETSTSKKSTASACKVNPSHKRSVERNLRFKHS